MFNGMQRDLSVSKHPAQFIYDGRNIRLTARGEDTLLSVTNEKSTASTSIVIEGYYLGHCLLNNYLVVFSTLSTGETSEHTANENDASDKPDYIIRVDLETLISDELYHGNLGFSTKHPIEAIGSYENEDIQKVYWTDGENQPRVINIAGDYSGDNPPFDWDDSSFDFVRKLSLQETVSIKKSISASGRFPAGVIQYSFTYFSKYGQESNIFYTSPLLYVSPKDRGGAADEMVNNIFTITVDKVDTHFDYLRIYSIERTSVNGDPICKRLQDIEIAGMTTYEEEGVTYRKATFIDTGTVGDSVDPTELLYKGGETIKAQTLEQKDGTLFLGNLHLERESLGDVKNSIHQSVSIYSSKRQLTMPVTQSGGYSYSNQLTSYDADGNSVPCSGFKAGNYYRLGLQFQHETGRWSDPIFKDDYPQLERATEGGGGGVDLPVFKGVLSNEGNTLEQIKKAGYKKVRAVAVYPDVLDRVSICQGVTNPTLYTSKHRTTDKDIYAQSSWFFRPFDAYIDAPSGSDVLLSPFNHRGSDYHLPYAGVNYPGNPMLLRWVEIEGLFKQENQFAVDTSFNTFHSPDVLFDDYFHYVVFDDTKYKVVGSAAFSSTFADISLQTETPSIFSSAGGFVKPASLLGNYSDGLISGVLYEDRVVDDNNGDFESYSRQLSTGKWLVYPWQSSGSLNNDINRPSGKGVQSAVLKKKVLSNLRYSFTDWQESGSLPFASVPKLFSSNEVSILKFDDDVYEGNIDTLLSSDTTSTKFFGFGVDANQKVTDADISTQFNTTSWRTLLDLGIYSYGMDDFPNSWSIQDNNVGNSYAELRRRTLNVRMKYKSTPHLAFKTSTPLVSQSITVGSHEYPTLPIVEILRPGDNPSDADNPYYRSTMFGGTSPDALKANTWIPCGEPVSLDDINTLYVKDGREVSSDTQGAETLHGVVFEYSWGDTYYQRWDCMKTYPFTQEDANQIVEIGSFMLETYVNIDGRYDRNRGQTDNTNMSPQNFNLLNPVYGQVNNFFSYKILDDDFYKLNSFPNQITWTKEKQSGADVDAWTNITLANTYDMDGSKGEVLSLNTWKDQLFCFQKKGISNILFNSRVQIPTSDGVPIEISNSYKVDGYRYLSDGIGCDNKFTIKETPSGIYFIDSVSNNLFHIGEGIQDVATTHNMTSWFKTHTIDRVVYDSVNHDVYMVNASEVLCFSEILGQFTGFYDYGGISLMETCEGHVFALKEDSLYKLFEGNGCCNFFGTNYPYSLTFICNGGGNNAVTMDKVFTNLEFRATVEDDGEVVVTDVENPSAQSGFRFYLPFDFLECWDEHQHGFAALSGNKSFRHHDDTGAASLLRKFRIWRCDIPRNNAPLGNQRVSDTVYSTDAELGISRYYRKPMDRLRNPWLYLKFMKQAAGDGEVMKKVEVQDLVVSYYL